MNIIDLRSDTFTQPTDAMREAMAGAEVGDDVFEEDPSVKKLEQLAANKMGKEAALFVPSGTMGNLVSVLTHCNRGDEVLLGDQSHIFLNEVGGIAALGGIHPRTLPNQKDGTLDPDALNKAVRSKNLHCPPTRLICLENTHNYCQGTPLTPAYMENVAKLAARHSLKIHLDGARIFNAAIALKTDGGELAQKVDSVMFCLSKGLSAPVGSLICGSREFIAGARKNRKMVGGGMRQAGHLAAAGIVALEDLVDRLTDDHDNAQKLARGLAGVPGVQLNLDSVKTNIIFFNFRHPDISGDHFLEKLDANGVKIMMLDPGIYRAVLHRGITGEQIDEALEVFQSVLALALK